MSGPLKNKTHLMSDTSKWYGITPPISEDLPVETDLVQTRKLTKCLRSFDIFEDYLEQQHREKVVKRLESLFKEWLKEMCVEMNVPEYVRDNVGGKVLPFGSYGLGAYSKGADIDILCVGPGFIKRKDFFTSFYGKLKAQEVKSIRAIEEAFVPVIKLIYDGVEVDMVIALVLRKSIPESLNLLDDKLLQDMDKCSVMSLNGYRVTEEILHLVPNIHNFQLALRAIKLWAKCRNIYSNMLGFLGGISLAILVARVCQLYPNVAASTLVIKFFKVYSMWEWSIPVRLRVVEDRRYNLSFWDPTFNASDRCHMMPIITPAYPQQNTSFNVSPSTMAVITEEIERGHTITTEIEQQKANWSKLFEKPNFFEKYQHYVLIQVTSAEKQHPECVSLVESKIRHLVGILERNRQITRAHLHTQSFPGPQVANEKEEVSTQWLIGLLINTDRIIDLSLTFPSFIDTIYSLAQSSKVYEDGMIVSAVCDSRDNLNWAMPDGTRKKVFCPAPKPAVSHQTATATAPTTQYDKPAKRVKASSSSSALMSPCPTKRPCSPSSVGSSSKRPIPDGGPALPNTKPTSCEEIQATGGSPSGRSGSMSGTSNERPGTAEAEILANRCRSDQGLPTLELSDVPLSPSKPVAAVKRPIKLHLISKRND